MTITFNQSLDNLRQQLRRGQRRLADWDGGQMAVSAVPGSGKSHSLSVAAAIAIIRHQLHPRKQLVIVTYTRSAAAAIKAKIKERLKELNRPQAGFMVQTLHGLALQISSRYPNLSGIDLENATIVIPTPSHRIIRTCVEKWIKDNIPLYQILLEGVQFDGEETERLRRQSVLRTEVLPSLAHIIIREAKSSGLYPEDIKTLSQNSNDPYQILAIASGLYETYQTLMKVRNFIDYDEMILAALRVLEKAEIRQYWQQQIFAVFEDEAQDSSPLQEQLISCLAINPETKKSNLIRVGDPNQAINSTFTPADPVYFNYFCETCDRKDKLATIDQAGRSNITIIKAANLMLEWVNNRWQNQTKKDPINALSLPFRLQTINPVDKGDPQPNANPDAVGKGLEIYTPKDIYQTVELIGNRVIQLFADNPQTNAAILVRENRQGRFLTDQLDYLKREHNIPVYDVNEAHRFSKIPLEILRLLQFIDRPHSPDYLKAALEILEQRDLIPAQDLNALATYPEQFLYPTSLQDEAKKPVKLAQKYCCNLLKAKIELPQYQLIPFLGMTLKYTGGELATVQKLSERLNQQIKRNSSLKNTITALNDLVASENFEAVEEDSDDYYTRPGQLTIITMHKAKGLDWDYVFLPFLHKDVLPGNLWTPTSAKFLGEFTLAEVARAQIRSAIHHQHINPEMPYKMPEPMDAWKEAERLKEAEEYRLLYVAMTRAKRLLWMSAAQKAPFRWNTFRSEGIGNLQFKEACPVIPLLSRQFPHNILSISSIMS
ncbi:MAG: ATP-dependent helicase [Microcystaceae cyanobacterium]